MAVVISPEEYDRFTQLKLQSLKAVVAGSIAQADAGGLHSIDDVFAPLTADEIKVSVLENIEVLAVLHQTQDTYQHINERGR